ncbi:MAG: RNA polymerase sigma factor SigJ [Rhodospirillales bacterium]
MRPDSDTALYVFQDARPRLWGLAYRMLGSRADADDAVQDTFLKWQAADHGAIEVPEAWLTAVCTRRCVDMLRAAHRTRVDYVGPWLPEPLVMVDDSPNAAEQIELADSLSMAFLLLLERLSPPERAAYLLREVFDYDYAEVSRILEKSPDACRQMVSRARRHLADDGDKNGVNKGTKGGKPRHSGLRPDAARRDQLLDGFLDALQSGEAGPIEALLAEDAALWSDGGGKAAAALNVIHGANNIARFLAGIWNKNGHGFTIERTVVNGDPGVIFREAGEISTVTSFAVDRGGRITGVFIVRNPDKLPRS